MSSTKYKYILVLINVIVIAISICVLIYVYKTENNDFVESVLIGVALIGYTIALFATIAIGLESVFLLTIVALIAIVLLISSYAFLVYEVLDTFIYPDNSIVNFVNTLLLVINVILSVQLLAESYLIYAILIQRRKDNINQYRVTKALNL